MAQDVEMKDNHTPSQSTMQHLKEIADLIDTGSYTKEVRRIARAVRLTIGLRRKLTSSVLTSFLDFALVPGSEPHSRLSSFTAKGDEHDMEVDTATSATSATSSKNLPSELEIYCYFIVLLFLIDQKKYPELNLVLQQALLVSRTLTDEPSILVVNRRVVFILISSLTVNSLVHLNLLALHHSATLRHDELGQETLVNLLLRNYFHYNLYDQAEKLRSKAPPFEAHSNQQCALLLILCSVGISSTWGRSEPFSWSTQMQKKVSFKQPGKPLAAPGFRIQCNKWAILVRLLLGEIPERPVFIQKGMEKALRPYFELTNAVRIGDLELFRTVQEKFSETFAQDRTHNLIVRLRHNVIRTGLRNISISYSRISLPDGAI
uniref:Uncharacterized protein n=1 Tax=Brassica oleracea TaxID=3712 RepID=A0A3P6EQ87_BRAOL|nr:unnamed protein product [Brassica oleracea]